MGYHPWCSKVVAVMSKSFIFYQDPGHGWVAVSRKDLAAIGLTADNFSRYSHRSSSGNTFYLEEDCDAPIFFAAYLAKYGEKPTFVDKHTNNRSRIRSLPDIGE